MNSKKCKRVRRMAERATVARAAVFYDCNSQTGQVKVAEGCTRFAYHWLKRNYQWV
jgi:hypothetical protein